MQAKSQPWQQAFMRIVSGLNTHIHANTWTHRGIPLSETAQGCFINSHPPLLWKVPPQYPLGDPISYSGPQMHVWRQEEGHFEHSPLLLLWLFLWSKFMCLMRGFSVPLPPLFCSADYKSRNRWEILEAYSNFPCQVEVYLNEMSHKN